MAATASPRVLVPHRMPPGRPAPEAVLHRLEGRTMGTTWSVGIAAPRGLVLDSLRREIEAQLDSVVGEMSPWEPDSALSRFQRAAPGTWFALPEAMFEVLAHALAVARASGGAFDPTAGALVEAWGFGPARPYGDATFCPPDADRIQQARAACGWQRIRLDATHRRALQPGGVQLDLCAIAKGHAVDRVAQRLAARGLVDHLVEIGGELRGGGVKPDGHPWWVALEDPPGGAAGRQVSRPDAPQPTLVALHGLAVATSGDYRRGYHHAGRWRPHSIDPRTGRPIEHGLASVTVLHAQCRAADALSTALTVLGPVAGPAWATAHDIAARFLTRRAADGHDEQITPAFAALAV